MNTTTTKTTHAIVTMSVLLALAYTSTLCEASLVKMGLNRDKMPVDIEEVLPAYDRFKDLRLQETRKLQVTTIFSSDFSSIPSIPTNDQDASSLSLAETTTVTSSAFNDFNETLSPFFDMDEEVDGDEDDLVLEEEEKVAVEVKEENVVVAEEHVALVGGTTNTVAPVTTITTPQTGPRGGHEDPSPRIEPTEISFMIVGFSLLVPFVFAIPIFFAFDFFHCSRRFQNFISCCYQNRTNRSLGASLLFLMNAVLAVRTKWITTNVFDSQTLLV